VTSILELDRLLRRAVDLAVEVLGAERGFILLCDDGAPEPTVRVARDVNQRDLEPAEYQLNAEVLRQVSAEQKPRAASEDLTPAPSAKPGMSRSLRSILCVPLVIKDRPLGLLYVDNRLVKDLFREPDIELLSTFAAQVAVAIENARTYRKIEELNIGLEEKVRERTAELLKAKMVLEKANLMKDEFLANMSHELRTPLNAVIALSDILAEETFGPLNAKQKKYVVDIIQSGTHLLSLINDILDLSKIEAGQMTLQISDFDLNNLLTESLVMVKERAGKASISLDLDLDPLLPLVRGDHRKIKQVVFNLLANAVKFTEDGGRVMVRSRKGAEEVTVSIEDTGIGIAPENLGKVFVEFQQIESSLSRNYQGTGLGLALSKRFVELHQGRIWVESEPRKGSRFSFTVPIMREAPPETVTMGSGLSGGASVDGRRSTVDS
jgi:signal transduction histidine kinase